MLRGGQRKHTRFSLYCRFKQGLLKILVILKAMAVSNGETDILTRYLSEFDKLIAVANQQRDLVKLRRYGKVEIDKGNWQSISDCMVKNEKQVEKVLFPSEQKVSSKLENARLFLERHKSQQSEPVLVGLPTDLNFETAEPGKFLENVYRLYDNIKTTGNTLLRRHLELGSYVQ